LTCEDTAAWTSGGLVATDCATYESGATCAANAFADSTAEDTYGGEANNWPESNCCICGKVATIDPTTDADHDVYTVENPCYWTEPLEVYTDTTCENIAEVNSLTYPIIDETDGTYNKDYTEYSYSIYECH
jgi:hypothetical protein